MDEAQEWIDKLTETIDREAGYLEKLYPKDPKEEHRVIPIIGGPHHGELALWIRRRVTFIDAQYLRTTVQFQGECYTFYAWSKLSAEETIKLALDWIANHDSRRD